MNRYKTDRKKDVDERGTSHRCGCLWVVFDVDNGIITILCSSVYVTICGKGGLVDCCCHGSFLILLIHSSYNPSIKDEDRKLNSPGHIHSFLRPSPHTHYLWPRGPSHLNSACLVTHCRAIHFHIRVALCDLHRCYKILNRNLLLASGVAELTVPALRHKYQHGSCRRVLLRVLLLPYIPVPSSAVSLGSI